MVIDNAIRKENISLEVKVACKILQNEAKKFKFLSDVLSGHEEVCKIP